MIIEVNTRLLDTVGNLNSSQLIFLSLVLDKNQKAYNQDVRNVISLISEDDISNLISRNLITSIERGNKITYLPTDLLESAVKQPKEYFDLFYDMYPVYVMRPDGSKSYLRINVNKCRHFFNTLTGNSSAMAEHLIQCLDFEVKKRMGNGSLQYMKNMWNWLTGHVWEESEQEMQDVSTQTTSTYGTELI